MRAPKKSKISVPQQVLAVAKKASAPKAVVAKPSSSTKSKVISALKRLHPMD